MRDFAETLRNQLEPRGVNVVLDQFLLKEKPGGPDKQWPLWSANQVRDASRVLIVGTAAWMDCFLGKASPSEGRGAATEARMVYQQLYDSHWISVKFRVVLFDSEDAASIADEIKGLHRFTAGTDNAAIIAWASPPPDDPGPAGTISFPIIPPDIEWPLADGFEVREAVKKILCAQSEHRIVLLGGETNRGKSEICRVLRGLRADFKWLRCGRFELKGATEIDLALDDFIRDLQAALPASAPTAAHQRANELLDALDRSPQPTLLVIDAFNEGGEFRRWVEERVLDRVKERDWLRVVVAGQNLPGYATAPCASLVAPPVLVNRNEVKDWLEYGRRWKKDLAEHKVEAIYEVAGDDHRMMQTFIMKLCGR